jgi:hypothetical protein
MDPIIIAGMVRAGGVQTSFRSQKTRIEILVNPGQSLQIAQLIELMEQGVICKLQVVGDKGLHLDLIAAIWKIRTTIDGGMTAVFEMEKGNAVNAVKMADSSVLLETLEITVIGDPLYGFQTRRYGKSTWTPQKRQYPN